jgi:pyridoxine 4-dehydrogenase
LTYCERNAIGFVPFWPLHVAAVATSETLAWVAAETAATPSQLALAWLLRKSPAIILIPGTSSVAHLEQNVAARDVELSDAHMAALEQLGSEAV